MLSARGLFDYARRLCEAREHPERLERLFALAAAAQDRKPGSRGYGNLRWTWRDPGVTDANAVEFCMQDAAAIWIDHREWIPEPARQALRDVMEYAIQGCLRHRVPSSYTNIAVLNAANLIVLGELFGRPEVTAEGAGRLDALYLWTWQFGLREFCSPTYYGVDLDGLRFIESRARLESARRQARQLAQLVWTDIAANWYVPAQKLAGAHSRSYDYLAGLGSLDVNLRAAGWLESDGRPQPEKTATYWPPASLLEISRRVPRLVRQHWGTAPVESRTHWLCADVTLSTSGAGSGQDDARLTVDLPGDRRQPRCYFIPDGREDPCGKIRYETGSALHMKALHLTPFWAAAQRGPDALGLVVYRAEDLKAPEIVNLQSHMVLRRACDGLWLAGRRIESPAGTSSRPARWTLGAGQALVVKYATAALGVRVLWARRDDGRPAEAALVDDGNPHGVVRLTVEHRGDRRAVEAGAAFWVQVASGASTDKAFHAWRARFEKATVPSVQVSATALRFEVPGQQGPVSVDARSPLGQGDVRLQPEPTSAVLELDGHDIGRPMLEELDPARRARTCYGPLHPLAVPERGGIGWEAEAALVFHSMAVGDDPAASARRYVWQPPPAHDSTRAAGSVLWTIEVPRPGRYFLWGRVSAPDPQTDSFYVQVIAPGVTWPASTAWHLRSGPGWTWQVLSLNRAKTPEPLNLPAGPCRILLRPREPGTKLDRLWLGTDPADRPPL
jgi:hypothetical protein